MIHRYFMQTVALLMTVGLACNQGRHQAELAPKPGFWELRFDLSAIEEGLAVPVQMKIDSTGAMTIRNGGELIEIDSVHWLGQSFRLKMPYFQVFLSGILESDTLISGKLIDPTRSADYVIPFTGKFVSEIEHSKGKLNRREIYEAHFSPGDTIAGHRAVGIFDFYETTVSGTFLTETGDYRFLQGKEENGELDLSSFDGARLFHFKGKVAGDSIVNGRFYSGIHWSEPWWAIRNERARLRDPDSLTFILPESGPFSFAAKTLGGESVVFDREYFKDGVTVVQIFGSWCPNCIDETIYLKSLYERLHARGLKIVPVAFERALTEEENVQTLRTHLREIDLKYPVYLGGSKKDASQVFPMLNRVMSFPTTLIVDRRGEVRKIHTGFYGPGTGDYFIHYTDRLELLVTQLLGE